ncbi:hypothetical protein ZIOFF_001620 [Zingiber officinale]|uniref:RING-type domain-containing protein n=1 Tax=Zingiber officinale TaxID=94328 RepID=A0A8J5HYW2_ZINOF|nr:hypothetical protein ZIOFF_001620 [Zingiber officinale]
MIPRASDFPTEYDGACLQMRMSYSSAAHLFLFLVQWTDCSLAGALGLLRIMIYKVHSDGSTSMSNHERKASLKEFYTIIFPSLLQLQKGLTEMEFKRQKAEFMERYKRKEEDGRKNLSEIDLEREEECGICLEMNSKLVLPNCSHSMCLKCYRDWNTRSKSCPFCRDSLKEVNSGDLWVLIDNRDIIDIAVPSVKGRHEALPLPITSAPISPPLPSPPSRGDPNRAGAIVGNGLSLRGHHQHKLSWLPGSPILFSLPPCGSALDCSHTEQCRHPTPAEPPIFTIDHLPSALDGFVDPSHCGVACALVWSSLLCPSGDNHQQPLPIWWLLGDVGHRSLAATFTGKQFPIARISGSDLRVGYSVLGLVDLL